MPGDDRRTRGRTSRKAANVCKVDEKVDGRKSADDGDDDEQKGWKRKEAETAVRGEE